jgi:hypothetical protein
MSVIGTKRTSESEDAKSAFDPKADIRSSALWAPRLMHVRSGGDDAAGDAVSRIAGGIAHRVIGDGVNHDGRAILVK